MGLVLQDLHNLFNVLFLMVVFIDITDMPSTKDTKTQLLFQKMTFKNTVFLRFVDLGKVMIVENFFTAQI